MDNNKSIINGIDVSEYFIEVVDEGGSTINYKILPNFERLLVEKIFEQNQQLARLQKENEGLKKAYSKLNDMCNDNCDFTNKLEQALEEIREIAKHNQFYDPRYFMIRGDIGQIQNIKMTEIYERCNKELNEK
jgi:hypothetical protein